MKEWLCLNCQVQQLSGESPLQPQTKTIPTQGPAEWKETPVASQKKSSLSIDVTDSIKGLSKVGKSEDQPLVPVPENFTSSVSKPSPAKSSQHPKSDSQKEDKGLAISQASAKAASVLPASVETVTSGKTKSPTVQKQKEIKPADEAPNAQSVIAPSAQEKGDTDLSKLPKDCPICKKIFKKDPPNNNTCNSCKAIVCNLCGGSNTRAEITGVRENPTKY